MKFKEILNEKKTPNKKFNKISDFKKDDLFYYPTTTNYRLLGVKEDIGKGKLKVSLYKVISAKDDRIVLSKLTGQKQEWDKNLNDEFLEIVKVSTKYKEDFENRKR